MPTSAQPSPDRHGRARLLVLLRAGAHLYGTATPASDLDAKSVILPAARDILLQRVQATTVESRLREPGGRLDSGDPDVETHNLQRYLTLLAANQPLAIEMLMSLLPSVSPPPRQSAAPGAVTGDRRIEIALPDGTCIRVGADVGLAALRRVIAAVRR